MSTIPTNAASQSNPSPLVKGQLPTTGPVLPAKNPLQEVMDFYNQTQGMGKFHGMIVADKGMGKTTLAATLPKPIYIMSVSPGGTQTIRHKVLNRQVVVDSRYENDDLDKPDSYLKFFKNFAEMRQSSWLKDNFASFVLDGLTELGRSLMWHLVVRDGRAYPKIDSKVPIKRDDYGPTFHTWDIILNTMVAFSNQIASLPVHTAITCHIEREMDELSRTFLKMVMFPGQSKVQIPMRMPEVYYILGKAVGQEKIRYILTSNDGEYQASTRMGAGGKISKEVLFPEPPKESEKEVQILQNLLKQCDCDWQDKGDGRIQI